MHRPSGRPSRSRDAETTCTHAAFAQQVNQCYSSATSNCYDNYQYRGRGGESCNDWQRRQCSNVSAFRYRIASLGFMSWCIFAAVCVSVFGIVCLFGYLSRCRPCGCAFGLRDEPKQQGQVLDRHGQLAVLRIACIFCRDHIFLAIPLPPDCRRGLGSTVSLDVSSLSSLCCCCWVP